MLLSSPSSSLHISASTHFASETPNRTGSMLYSTALFSFWRARESSVQQSSVAPSFANSRFAVTNGLRAGILLQFPSFWDWMYRNWIGSIRPNDAQYRFIG